MNEAIHNGWDLWTVQLVCALPLAASLAAAVRGHLRLTAAAGCTLGVQLALLLGVPWIYRQARCQYEMGQLAGLLEQSRVGEAAERCRSILRLDRKAQLAGTPVTSISAEVEQTLRALDARVQAPLAADAADEIRLARSQDLAMLDRTDAALDTLAAVGSLENSPNACNLRGTIHETRREWKLARQWYERARRAWQSEEPAPERTAGIIRATTGVGFAERKLGRYPEAEAAYAEVLSLAPTAESHFLLAQFYDDTQQATKSLVHARAAMALDPVQFTGAGQQLIDKLATLHFGCWMVRATGPPAAAETKVRNSKAPETSANVLNSPSRIMPARGRASPTSLDPRQTATPARR